MSVRLLVKQRSEEGGAEKGTEVLLDEETITLGRDRSCQVVLAQQAVSRTHARISRDGSLFFVEDLGSAYGTQINGQALPKGEKRLLRNGDVIAVAQFDVTFDRVAEVSRGGDSNAHAARQVVKDVMRGLASGAESPFFRVMNGPTEGQKIEVQDAQELIVGRDDVADIVLNNDLVSRRHAKIRRDWSGTHVEDLESRNGIRVNRKRVARKTLKDRDELEIGGVRLLYLDPAEVRDAPLLLPDEGVDDQAEATTHEPESDERSMTPPPDEEPAVEPPPEPIAAEPPPPDSDAELSASDEPAEDEEFEESEIKPGVGGLLGRLRSGRNLIPVVAMGIFAMLALLLVIAVLAGA